MQTLARMTGKDFSGPPPEIRAPTPLRLPDETEKRENEDPGQSVKVRKHSATPGLGEEEIIGEIEEIVEEYDA